MPLLVVPLIAMAGGGAVGFFAGTQLNKVALYAGLAGAAYLVYKGSK